MSFITPLFLIAISAALLPVLFHFVRKMKAKQVPFGSLMFLKATPKELIKRRRLRDLLLMALRAAIFGLLAFVFARPFIPQDRLPFVTQRQDESVVILIDHSYSMQVGDLFERAKQEVLSRLDAAGSNDEFSLIAFGDDARQLTPLTGDLALHRTVATELTVGNRPTDFYNPLRLAAEILKDARHDDRTIVLISDYQRGGFAGRKRAVELVEQRVSACEVRIAAVGEIPNRRKSAGEPVCLHGWLCSGSRKLSGLIGTALALDCSDEASLGLLFVDAEERRVGKGAEDPLDFAGLDLEGDEAPFST